MQPYSCMSRPLVQAPPRALTAGATPESKMRILPLVPLLLLFAAPGLAQPPRLGARPPSPEAMGAQMSQVSPEEEMRQLVAAADAHPLGSAENPVRVGGAEGERAYLARPRCPDGAM